MSAGPKASNGMETVLLKAGVHLLWKWPMGVSAAFWRAAFDHLRVSAAICAVALGASSCFAVVDLGVRHSNWGASVARAWQGEQVATRRVKLLRVALERHQAAFPSDTAAYPVWRSQGDALRAAIAESSALVPSWGLPWAPPWTGEASPDDSVRTLSSCTSTSTCTSTWT